MFYSWRHHFEDLQQYVAANPEIHIDKNRTVIPSELREGFYQLFDAMRDALVAEVCAPVLESGFLLSSQYQLLERMVMDTAGVDSIVIADELKWFLKDPCDGLSRLLFNPLFDLLAGRIELLLFEENASRQLLQDFFRLHQTGYQRWLALAIIHRLSVDQSYRVPAMDNIENVILGEGHERPGQHVDDVPVVQEFNSLSFEQNPVISFIVPRLLVHSAKLDTCIAMHFDFREAEWTARKTSNNVEWLDIAGLKSKYELVNLRPDLFKKHWFEMDPVLPDLALYRSAELDDLVLVADYNYMMRPEINLEIMVEKDWLASGRLADIMRHHEAMNPRKGTFIVCLYPLSDEEVIEFNKKIAEQQENCQADAATPAAGQEATEAGRPVLPFNLLQAGYDIQVLDPLMEALAA